MFMTCRKDICRPICHCLANIFLKFASGIIREVAHEAMEPGPVKDDSVQIIICRQILQQTYDIVLHIRMDRVEELFVSPDVHNGLQAFCSIHDGGVLRQIGIPEDHTVLAEPRNMTTAECVETGIYIKTCLMAFFDERLQVIPA